MNRVYIYNEKAYVETWRGWRIFPAPGCPNVAYDTPEEIQRHVPLDAVVEVTPTGSVIFRGSTHSVHLAAQACACEWAPATLPSPAAVCTLATVPSGLVWIEEWGDTVYVALDGRVAPLHGTVAVHVECVTNGCDAGVPGTYVTAEPFAGALAEAAEYGAPVSLVSAPTPDIARVYVVAGDLEHPRYVGIIHAVDPVERR